MSSNEPTEANPQKPTEANPQKPTEANPQNSINPKKPTNLREFLARSVIVHNHAKEERLNYLEKKYKTYFCAICECVYERDFRTCACGHVYCYYHQSNLQIIYLDNCTINRYCIKCQPNKQPLHCTSCGKTAVGLNLTNNELHCITCLLKLKY